MAAPGLQEPAKKALATLDREWDGLAAHRDYPMISLDNNAAERALRRPVVTRKNAYGSRTEDAARLAARVWTITATAERAGLNPITYLTAYLDACGRTGGTPPTGPTWNGSCPGPRPAKTWTRLGTATPPRLTLATAPSRRHRRETVTSLPSMPSTGLPNTAPYEEFFIRRTSAATSSAPGTPTATCRRGPRPGWSGSARSTAPIPRWPPRLPAARSGPRPPHSSTPPCR